MTKILWRLIRKKKGKVLTFVAVEDDLYIYLPVSQRALDHEGDHDRDPNSWAIVYNLKNTLTIKTKVLGKEFLVAIRQKW